MAEKKKTNILVALFIVGEIGWRCSRNVSGDRRWSFSTMSDRCVPQLEKDLSEMFWCGRREIKQTTSKRGGAIECNSHVLVYHDLSALLNHLGRVVPSTFNLSCSVYFQPSVNHGGPSQIEVTKWCAAWDFPHPWTTGTLHSENYAWGQADWPAIWRG